MIFSKLSMFFSFVKVALMCIAAIYIVFWFWQFFNLPLTDVLKPIFDFTIAPILFCFKYFKIENEFIVQFSYVIMGAIIFLLSWIAGRFEKLCNICQFEVEKRDIVRRIEEEKKMNEELAKELEDDLLEYEYYSIYLKYQITYANEIIAQNKSCTIVGTLERSYNNTADFIRRKFPELGVRQNKSSIFVRGKGFEDIDKVVTCVLGAIRQVKILNAQDAMNTKFLIVIDSQKNEADSSKSSQKLEKIAENAYYNKAIVTTSFKMRFDLIRNESKFETEPLGVSVSYDVENPEELYVFRTKIISNT